jgi:hypothetical protein
LEVDQIWEKAGTKDKFIELEELMEGRTQSKKLIAVVFLNRLQSILITIGSGSIIFYLYLYKEYQLGKFNCLLPESHFYEVTTAQEKVILIVCFSCHRVGCNVKNNCIDLCFLLNIYQNLFLSIFARTNQKPCSKFSKNLDFLKIFETNTFNEEGIVLS